LNDPLNWPVWKKNVAFYSIIVFAALTNWVIGGLGVGVVQVTIEFNKDLSSVVQDTISWCILTLGCGVLPLPPVPCPMTSKSMQANPWQTNTPVLTHDRTSSGSQWHYISAAAQPL
jgi:hypothetical protein